MNTKAIFRVVAAIVAIFVVAQFIHTVIKVNYEEVRTEVVVDTSVSDTLDMKVFVAREESYITNDDQGIDVAVVEDEISVGIFNVGRPLLPVPIEFHFVESQVE